MLIYLIGSLKNPRVPVVAEALRAAGFDVFSDWYAPGPNADDHLRDYCRGRGLTYQQIMATEAVSHIVNFDMHWLGRADAAVLLAPAGKSAHLELGWALGKGKPGFILMEHEPERIDVMHYVANKVCHAVEELIGELHGTAEPLATAS